MLDQLPASAVGSGKRHQRKCAATMAEQDEVATPTMSPLAHLTSQSAAFGQWGVLIFAPDAQEREYIYQKKKSTAYNFCCLLVSTQDPTQYVLGESRGQGMSAQVLKTWRRDSSRGSCSV